MGTIDRKYSYHDDGVLPSEGEYGVTYLTLYSSGAGNVYDGWLWDPDRRNYSETERTFGYRNPDYEDYCWDDEVVVDLSNAQARQETSDFAQGRITSFNTNVSNVPIILQDVDITGLDEEEREAKATTVLFSKIPLVKDAYIQAAVEVQCKVNISPDNTNGMVRVEAFYILNDESDRTMRPNPVHTFSVSTDDERHTLPWLYWNPALKHEDNNYIGVKLLCTGGTAEIGISDDPDYGDAMITLTSAGLIGDHVDSGYPISLEIYGKDQVPSGYKLIEDDYTVLCTYDTGEIYDVTRLCNYSPGMGEKIVNPVTTLTAYYQGLSASMIIYLALVESINLIGLADFYEDTYTFNRDDYVVLAHYDNGDVMDISDDPELVYDPPMGTTINDDTVLTATYTPEYMPSSEFEDSIEVVKHIIDISVPGEEGGGLIYTLYDDNTVVITGSSNHYKYYEHIEIPSDILNRLGEKEATMYKLEWNASGPVSGIYLDCDSVDIRVSKFVNFNSIKIKPKFKKNALTSEYAYDSNPIILNFNSQNLLTSRDLLFLYDSIDFSSINDVPTILTSYRLWGSQEYYFANITSCDHMFAECENLDGLSFARNWITTGVTSTNSMFYKCINLHSAADLQNFDMKKVKDASSMFESSGLNNFVGFSGWMIGSNSDSYEILLNNMFAECPVQSLSGLDYLIINKNHKYNLSGMFVLCDDLWFMDSIDTWQYAKISNINSIFRGCVKLQDIHCLSGWDVSDLESADGAFCDTLIPSSSQISSWRIPSKTYLRYAVFGTRVEIQPPFVPTPKELICAPWCDSMENWYHPDNDYTKYFPTVYDTDPITQETYIRMAHYYGGIFDDEDPSWDGRPCEITLGTFEVLDKWAMYINYYDETFYPGYPPCSIIFKFQYGEKLPLWYKQIIVDKIVEERSNHWYRWDVETQQYVTDQYTGYLIN